MAKCSNFDTHFPILTGHRSSYHLYNVILILDPAICHPSAETDRTIRSYIEPVIQKPKPSL